MSRLYARGRMDLARHYPHQHAARYIRRRTIIRWAVWGIVVLGLLATVAAMPVTRWAL